MGPADGPVSLPANRLKLNSKIAAMLGSPMLLILDYAPDHSIDAFNSKILIAAKAVRDFGAEVLGIIVNKVKPLSYFQTPFPLCFSYNSKPLMTDILGIL